MAYDIQLFQEGTVKKEGSQYLYVVKDKVVGKYDSMQELVKANEKKSESKEKKSASK